MCKGPEEGRSVAHDNQGRPGQQRVQLRLARWAEPDSRGLCRSNYRFFYFSLRAMESLSNAMLNSEYLFLERSWHGEKRVSGW